MLPLSRYVTGLQIPAPKLLHALQSPSIPWPLPDLLFPVMVLGSMVEKETQQALKKNTAAPFYFSHFFLTYPPPASPILQ